jgi:hypothetical protein
MYDPQFLHHHDAGSNVNQLDENQSSPLLLAASAGALDICDYLLTRTKCMSHATQQACHTYSIKDTTLFDSYSYSTYVCISLTPSKVMLRTLILQNQMPCCTFVVPVGCC